MVLDPFRFEKLNKAQAKHAKEEIEKIHQSGKKFLEGMKGDAMYDARLLSAFESVLALVDRRQKGSMKAIAEAACAIPAELSDLKRLQKEYPENGLLYENIAAYTEAAQIIATAQPKELTWAMNLDDLRKKALDAAGIIVHLR
jgi:hypothetical protein